MPKRAKNEARALLKHGALGIGEDHTKPHGRLLAIKLLEQPGLVKHLFVELNPSHILLLKKAEKLAKEGGSFEDVLKVAPEGGNFRCTVRQSEVIATALVNNIPVYAADDMCMFSASDKFKKRHTTIAATFEEVTKVRNAGASESAGCLLLWGSDHFVGIKSDKSDALENFIEGLPYIMMDESDADDSGSDDSSADESSADDSDSD